MCPELVRIWKVRLKGTDLNKQRIFNWRIEGSIIGENFTIMFTVSNPMYIDNAVHDFLIDTTNYCIHFRLFCVEAEDHPSRNMEPELCYMQLYIYYDLSTP